MLRLVLLSVLAIACVTPIWITLALCQQEETMTLRTYYENCIDQMILSCDAKMALSDSRSQNIRRMAAIALMKKAYLENYKEELVLDMIESNISARPYKVQYYLNSRFFDLVRSR